MITGDQVRMARAALRIGVRDLAETSGVAAMTISRIENGRSGGHADTIRKLQTALQAAGVEFIDDERGEGVVKLKHKSNGANNSAL